MTKNEYLAELEAILRRKNINEADIKDALSYYAGVFDDSGEPSDSPAKAAETIISETSDINVKVPRHNIRDGLVMLNMRARRSVKVLLFTILFYIIPLISVVVYVLTLGYKLARLLLSMVELTPAVISSFLLISLGWLFLFLLLLMLYFRHVPYFIAFITKKR